MWRYFLFAMTVVAVITEVESGGVSTYPSGYAYGLPPGSFQYPGPHTPSVTDYSYPQWPPGYGSQKPPKPPLPNITLPTDQQPTPGAPTVDTRPTGNGPTGNGPPTNGETPSRPTTPQQPPYWPPWGTSEYPPVSGQYKPKPGFPTGQQPGQAYLPSWGGGGGGYYPQWPGSWQQKPPKPIVLPQPQQPPQTTNITDNGQVQPPYQYWPPGAAGGQYKPKPLLPGAPPGLPTGQLPLTPVPDWRYPQPVPGQFAQWPGYGQQKPPKAPVAPQTNFTSGGQPQPFPGAPTIPQVDWRYGYPQYGTGAGYGGQPYWPYGSGVPAPGGGIPGYGQQKPKPIGTIPGTGYLPYPSGPYPGGAQQPVGVSAKPPKSLYPWGGYSQPTGGVGGYPGYPQYGYGQPVAPGPGAGQYYPGYGYSPQYQYPSTGYTKDKSGSKYG